MSTNSPPPRPFGPGAALLLLLVTFAANAVVLLIGDSLSDGPVGIVFFVAAAVLAPLVAVYVGLVRHAPDEATAPALRLELPRGRAWVHLLLAVGAGVALAPLALELTARVLEALPKEEAPDEAMAEWLAALKLPATQVLIAVAQIVVIPFAREALFRGFMQPRLVGVVGARRAIGIVVLIDLIAQPFPDVVPRAIVAAVPLSLLALWSRTTWAPLVAHVTLVVAQGALEVGMGMALPPSLLLGGAALALGFLALSWRLRVDEPPA